MVEAVPLGVSVVLLIAGVVILLVASSYVVDAAHRLGESFGLSPGVIGMTFVAFATSAPEMAVVVLAALEGDPDIATGSVVGSNIANVLIVVGVAAAWKTFRVDRRTRTVDIPVMVVASLVVAVLMVDRSLGRLDGLVLLLLLVAHVVASLRSESDDTAAESQSGRPAHRRARTGLMLVASAAVVAGAAQLVVTGARELATSVGVSELVIGLTVVSIGTSLPEITTSLVAAAKNQPDIALGNAIGSNIFNVLLVLGTASVMVGGGIGVADDVVRIDLPVMVSATLACLVVATFWRTFARWHGVAFIGAYGAYVVSLLTIHS